MELAEIELCAREALEGDGSVVFAYIFGSRASGRASDSSDVDLAFYMDDAMATHDAFWTAMRIAGSLQEALGKRVEAVVLNTAPPALRFEVIRTGELVLCRDESKQHQFWVRTVNEHADLAPVFALFRKSLREQIAGGDPIGERPSLGASIAQAKRVSGAIERLRSGSPTGGS